MPILLQKWIVRADLRANPDRLYLFGDNEGRVGTGGQAREMRGEPNAVGIRTKRTPGTDEIAYWNEIDPENHVRYFGLVNEDFQPILEALLKDTDLIVVVPTDGLGTGLAELSTRAPKTLRHIEDWLDILLHPERELHEEFSV